MSFMRRTDSVKCAVAFQAHPRLGHEWRRELRKGCEMWVTVGRGRSIASTGKAQGVRQRPCPESGTSCGTDRQHSLSTRNADDS
jgi:hypothetical protein